MDLPQELLAVLPQSAEAQLELASKIIGFAYANKVAQLEGEAQQLREAVIQKNNLVKTLERKLTSMEIEIQELQAKSKAAVEEQHKLQTEKTALIETVKKLNREVAKLEGFKRNLMQHLQDDTEPMTQLERSFAAVDLSSERLVADVLTSANKGGMASGAGVTGLTQHTTTSFSVPPSAASMSSMRASGMAVPTPSTSGRQSMGYGTGGVNMNNSYGAMGMNGGPLETPQHQQADSPTGHSDSPRIDGKEFFRITRARLSYEGFAYFLQNIKELNAGRQTRDETLRRAREIFGAQHADLYSAFESLLSKAATTF